MSSQCSTCDRERRHEMGMRQCRVCIAAEIQAIEFGIESEIARETAREVVDSSVVVNESP
jgi:hypothetical protein